MSAGETPERPPGPRKAISPDEETYAGDPTPPPRAPAASVNPSSATDTGTGSAPASPPIKTPSPSLTPERMAAHKAAREAQRLAIQRAEERTSILSTGCPSREQLELFAAGQTDLVEVADHLPRCPVCREIVARIGEDNHLVGDFVTANRDRFGSQSGSATSPFADAPPGFAPGGSGEVVPGFTVEGEIHRGAQGVVYRAIQLSTHRVVALKTMLQGRFATTRQRLRFEREVEVVASLRHPNIVTLYESGRTREGLAFFAMELVPGRPMNELLKEEPRATIEVLLPMFIELVRAIGYAHQRGVIHRDLKPGNILVDEEFKPHVLDFGLARTARGEKEDIEATAAGEFLGTFAYAAPEQLRGNPDLIDVRTDIFALGVILYEILVGERPWQTAGRGSIADLLIARLEETPKTPSTVRGGIDPDLDVIALKCLKGRAEERYQTCDALADDLERFLTGRPILARPDSIVYVARKWVARHRMATAAIALMVLIVVASAMAVTISLGLEKRSRLQAERRLIDFKETLGEINPETGTGTRQMTAVEFLDLVERNADKRADDDLAVAANMLNTVQGIRLSFNERSKVVEGLKRALEVSQRLAESRGTPDIPEVAEAHMNLGRDSVIREDYQAAVQHYNDALAMLERIHGKDSPECARTIQHLASCYGRMGELPRAKEQFLRVLAIQKKAHGEQSPEVAAALNGMAAALQRGGPEDKREALAAFEQAVALIRKSFGESDFRYGRGLYSIGTTKRMLGRPAEAADDLRRSLTILVSTLGDDAPRVVEARLELARDILEAKLDASEADRALAPAAVYLLDRQRLDHHRLADVCKLLVEVRKAMDDAAGAALWDAVGASLKANDAPETTAKRVVDALRGTNHRREALKISDDDADASSK